MITKLENGIYLHTTLDILSVVGLKNTSAGACAHLGPHV